VMNRLSDELAKEQKEKEQEERASKEKKGF
jgi:hypothetical protein